MFVDLLFGRPLPLPSGKKRLVRADARDCLMRLAGRPDMHPIEAANIKKVADAVASGASTRQEVVAHCGLSLMTCDKALEMLLAEKRIARAKFMGRFYYTPPGVVAAAIIAHRDARQAQIIAALRDVGGSASLTRIALECGIKHADAHKWLKRLIDAGQIVKNGQGARVRYQLKKQGGGAA